LIFVARFGNDPTGKNARQLGQYVSFLARMRSQGYAVEQIWEAFEQRFLGGNEAPIFGGTVAQVRDFLPAGSVRNGRAPLENDRSDDEIGAALEAKELRDMAS
jgi:hypothetical protein